MNTSTRSVLQVQMEEEIARLQAAHIAVDAGIEESRRVLEGGGGISNEYQTPQSVVKPGFSGRRAHRPSNLLSVSKEPEADGRIIPGWFRNLEGILSLRIFWGCLY